MTINEALMKTKTDPAFKKLSYQEQQEATKMLIDRTIMTDPGFMALAPTDRQSAYTQLINKAVIGAKPSLHGDTELTDEDRLQLQNGTYQGPQKAIKEGLWLGERLLAGDPKAAQEADGWIVQNRFVTESLIAQVAAGALDAVQALVDPDERPFDSIAFQSKNYQKISEYLMTKMAPQQAQATQAKAGVVSVATGLVETGLGTAVGIGTAKIPGLFTKSLWGAVNAAKASAITSGAVSRFATTMPFVISGVGSGMVDIARSLPRLLETKAIDGDGAFFKKVAQTFGEGVAYDVLFNGLTEVWRLGVHPTYQILRGFQTEDLKKARDIADLMYLVDPNTPEWTKAWSRILKDEMPAELISRLPKKEAAEVTQAVQRFIALKSVGSLDPGSAEGFKVLAKAMNMNIDYDPDGTIKVLNKSGGTYRKFGTRTEAASWALGRNWKPVDMEENEALLGASEQLRLRRFMKVDQGLNNLPTKQLTYMFGALDETGNIDVQTNLAVANELTRRGRVRRAGEPVKFKSAITIDEAQWNKSYDTWWTKPTDAFGGQQDYLNVLLLPKTMSPETKAKFFDYYNKVIKIKDPSLPGFSPGVTTRTTEGLNLAAGKIGGSVKQTGNTWQYQRPNSPKPMVFYDADSVNRQVMNDLLDTGALTNEDVGKILKQTTGYTLNVVEPDKTPSGLPSFELKTANGQLIQRADSLKALVNSQPMFELKLPDYMMPEMIVNNGNLYVSQTIAAGDTTTLLKLMDDFTGVELKNMEDPTFTMNLADGTAAEFTLSSKDFSYVVEVPNFGYSTKFYDQGQAREFLNKIGTSRQGLDRIAFDKGYRMDVTNTGAVVLRSDSGEGTVLRTVREVEEFLATKPSRDVLGKELVGEIPEELQGAMARMMKNSLAQMEWAAPSQHDPAVKHLQNFGRAIQPAISPFYSWVEMTADRLKLPELSEKVKNIQVRLRMVGAANYQDGQIIKEIFTDRTTGRLIKRNKRELFGMLLEVDPENWQQAAKNITHNEAFELSGDDIRMLRSARTTLEQYGTKFGVDLLGFFKNYVPHIQDKRSLDQLISDARNGDMDTMKKIMFGENSLKDPTINFMMRNERTADFLNVHSKKDIVDIFTYYVEKGNRERFLKDSIDDFGKYRESVKGVLGNTERARLLQFELAVAGRPPARDMLGGIIRDNSLVLSENLVKVFESFAKASETKAPKISQLFRRMAEGSVQENWLDFAMQNVSAAALGFRPFRIASNLAQFMNTYSVYGHWALEATSKVDSDYVVSLFRKGYLNERIMFGSQGEGIESFKKSLSDIALSWQQNSEYVTRAWTAKASELAFDNALPKFANGTIDFNGFLDLSNLTFLSQTSQQEIFDHLRKGTVEGIGAARDVAIRDSIRILMFDYAKENMPGAFQGTLGRLYGKFGTYKVGQVDLYRRLWNTRHSAQGWQRITRLMAASYLTYNAFQAVGIDYDGFKLQDPLNLLGGPGFQEGMDFITATGEGPEAAMARRNLAQSWNLLIPGYYEIRGLGKALDAYQRGAGREVLLNALSAPISHKTFDLMNYFN